MKTLASLNYATDQYFLLKLRTRFLLTNVCEMLWSFFSILFRSWVIYKSLKRPDFYTLVFYTFTSNSSGRGMFGSGFLVDGRWHLWVGWGVVVITVIAEVETFEQVLRCSFGIVGEFFVTFSVGASLFGMVIWADFVVKLVRTFIKVKHTSSRKILLGKSYRWRTILSPSQYFATFPQ